MSGQADTVALRPYRPADREVVVDLIWALNLFEDAISADRAPDREAAEACLEVDFARVGRDGGHLVVAEKAGRIVAFMTLVFETPQPFLRKEVAQVAWVSELVVAEGHRGQGIGTRLLHEAERLARASKVGRLMIGAITGNEAARAAYEKFGFRPAVIELAKDL